MLCQIRVAEDCTKTYEAIGLASKKFSDAAKSWDTMKKEYYACYFGIFIFAYYLRGKSFILKTYHNNILLIEKSLLPIVTRWRLYMESFMVCGSDTFQELKTR